eukprot:CAMPEP_0172537244 /NCGR_PEP_ID=MMETSP1067-20121228/8872_1 /TAXON_ID=265564 ORGANISM="Thalassiosira punctigera, Strain Tpunct2005C2" /NCGR_SAMPLE_ID=MMETSP1067 /ASSEMBLY_ACC=CAM_ASM_000444 /LENGTH=117 /DNA_ID=CAMNT_0013322499 /DNA_START=94 /DNA_END=447 /DNA_ORIENTATION=-
MNVNAFLLVILAASANAQDEDDPIDPCQALISSMKDCLEGDASESCEACLNGKFEESMESGDVSPDTIVALMTSEVDACKDRETSCVQCSSEPMAFVACRGEVMAEPVGPLIDTKNS